MKQNNINIAELLKDCERGTKLYSSLCGECEYSGITELGYISVLYDNQESGWDFDKYGYLCEDIEHKGECLLFPSKDARDWGCFRAKYVRGIEGKEKELKQLLDNNGCTNSIPYHCTDPDAIYYIDSVDGRLKALFLGNEVEKAKYDYIFSTGTELKLEETKFKVGDVVRERGGAMCIVRELKQKQAEVFYPCIKETATLLLTSLSPVTTENIKGWNERGLHFHHLHYSISKRKIIHWFMPFDRVLVRNNTWNTDLFSHYDKNDDEHYHCVGGYWTECLPYNEKTAKLIGTTDDYKEE